MPNPTREKTDLEARISHIAHIADKNLTAFPERMEILTVQYAPSLRAHLEQWVERGFEDNDRIMWAKEILNELESKTVAPCRRSQERDVPVSDDSSATIMDIVRARRSVRRWTSQEVPGALIDQLVEAARWAPSSGNRQAARLVVLTTLEARDVVVRMKEKFLSRAPVIILVGVDLRVYGKAERRSGLPFLDAAAAIQNILLVAHSLGLGCCWSKLCEDDWESQADIYFQFKAQLNLPGYFRPVSLVAVGWQSGQSRVPPRHEAADFTSLNEEGFFRPIIFRIGNQIACLPAGGNYANGLREFAVASVSGFVGKS